jgi:hypothetical protein
MGSLFVILLVTGHCLVAPEPRGAVIRSVETHAQGEATIRELPRLCRRGVEI